MAAMEKSLRVVLCKTCVQFKQERDYYKEKCRIYERQQAEFHKQRCESAIFPWNTFNFAFTEQRNISVNTEEVRQTQYIGFPSAHGPKGPLEQEERRESEEDDDAPTCRWTVYDSANQKKTCGRSFGSKRDVTAHIQEEHVNGVYTAQYACLWEGCLRREWLFNNKGLIMAHVSRIHVGDQQFHCPFKDCSRSFYFKCELDRHEMMHAGLKYKCPYPGCSKRFGQLRFVPLHLRAYHRGYGVRNAGGIQKPDQVPVVVPANQEPLAGEKINELKDTDNQQAEIRDVVDPQSTVCRNRCQMKIGKEDRMSLNRSYWKLKGIKEQLGYFNSLIEIVGEENLAESSGCQQLDGWRYVRLKCRFFVHVRHRQVQVCKVCFKKIFGETEAVIHKVVQKKIQRMRQNVSRSRGGIP